MTTPTPPAVSEAMREAVAQWVKFGCVRNLTAREISDHLLRPEGPIASEIARAEAAEAETARLRAERDGLQAIVLVDDAKALAEYEWERANKLADDNLRLTTALAEAEARGRRQGLEEAAKASPKMRRGNLIDFEEGWNAALFAYAKKLAASLATAPAETQKPETGESDHA